MTARHRPTSLQPPRPHHNHPNLMLPRPPRQLLWPAVLCVDSRRLDRPTLVAVPGWSPQLASCQINVFPECVHARASVGQKSVRWGSRVRKHAESGLTATPKDGRAARSIALAPIDPAARGLLAPARMRADVSTWLSTKLWDRAMRGWAASRARVRGS